MQELVKNFIKIYEELNTKNIKTNINQFENIYHQNIFFKDPIHETNNLKEFKEYFLNSAINLTHLKFTFKNHISNQETGYFEWDLCFSNENINKGKKIYLEGCSAIKMKEDTIYFHRDYYDLNEMVYSKVPILKNVTSFINKKISSK